MHPWKALLPALLLCALAPAGAQRLIPRQSLEVTLEKRAANDWQTIEPGRVLDQGDEVRFRVRSNLEGELYAYNRGPGGQAQLIFPRQEAGQANQLSPGGEVLIPEGGAFSISGPPGHDVVYWVVAPVGRGAPDLPSLAAAQPPRRPAAPQLTPSCDETILRARSICVDNTAGPQALQPTESQGLFGDGGFQSRSIGVKRQLTSAVITAEPSKDGVLVFEYRIPHR